MIFGKLAGNAVRNQPRYTVADHSMSANIVYPVIQIVFAVFRRQLNLRSSTMLLGGLQKRLSWSVLVT